MERFVLYNKPPIVTSWQAFAFIGPVQEQNPALIKARGLRVEGLLAFPSAIVAGAYHRNLPQHVIVTAQITLVVLGIQDGEDVKLV